MNFLSKIKFILTKPKVIVVVGSGRQLAQKAIFTVLEKHFNVKSKVLVIESDLENIKEINFLIRNSSLPILTITHLGQIPADKILFKGEKNEKICQLSSLMPKQGFLVLNLDEEALQEIKKEENFNELTFGFQEKADFKASDIMLNQEINFKINYKGNLVPVWLKKPAGKEEIYAVLAAACVGVIFGLNLVEISQALS